MYKGTAEAASGWYYRKRTEEVAKEDASSLGGKGSGGSDPYHALKLSNSINDTFGMVGATKASGGCVTSMLPA